MSDLQSEVTYTHRFAQTQFEELGLFHFRKLYRLYALLWLCLALLGVAECLEEEPLGVSLFASLIVTLLLVIYVPLMLRSIRRGYEQFCAANGVEEVLYTVTFGEKIAVFNTAHPEPVEYGYDKVVTLWHTENQLLLELALKLYVPLPLEAEAEVLAQLAAHGIRVGEKTPARKKGVFGVQKINRRVITYCAALILPYIALTAALFVFLLPRI